MKNENGRKMNKPLFLYFSLHHNFHHQLFFNFLSFFSLYLLLNASFPFFSFF